MRKPRNSETLPLDEGLSPIHKPLDALWAKFAGLTGRDEGQTCLLFVSPDHDAGTTTLATYTAVGLARNLEERVSLIEANFFSPAMASYLRLPPAPGITDVLDGKAPAVDALRNSKVDGLYVLSAGTPRETHQGELVGRAARDLFRRATEGSRYVVIDAPPLLAVPEARVLLDYADWVVLVLRSHSTRKKSAREALKVIEEAGAPVFGTVVNRFQTDMPFGLGTP